MLGTFVGGSSLLVDGRARHTLDVVDLDTDAVRTVALDFLPHGMTVKPGGSSLAVVFEKRGPGAALVDLGTMTARGNIKARAERHYYGHGAFSAAGDQLLSVETELATGRGVISVRDTTAYREVEIFPTYGDNPHDCVMIDEGKVLVVSNGGGPIGGSDPSVVYVDVASRKLLEKVTFSDPKVNAGHVAIRDDGSLAVVSAPRDGLPKETSAGAVHLMNAPIRTKKKAERMRASEAVMAKVIGESLSVAIHRDTVAVTNPLGGIVTFWSFSKKKLLASMALPNPRAVAITHDQSAFVIGYGPMATLLLVDSETLQPLERAFGDRRISGSHMFGWTIC